jgi:HSP20 family protein
MTTMTRWNPFKSLSAIDPTADFDDFFRRSALRPFLSNMEVAPDVRIDVTEVEGAYQVKADIPGVDKNDIDVSISDNQVSIGAEVRRETKQKEGEREIVTERAYGQVYRSFTLPSEVDSSKAEARYENGVLSLTLPKKANGSTRKLTVS